jgi:biotin carboxyl carrier protein
MANSVEIVAPVAGVVGSLPVAVGASVTAGEPVVVLQAMKTEFPVEAEQAGTVEEILVSEGQEVEMGAVMVRISAK